MALENVCMVLGSCRSSRNNKNDKTWQKQKILHDFTSWSMALNVISQGDAPSGWSPATWPHFWSGLASRSGKARKSCGTHGNLEEPGGTESLWGLCLKRFCGPFTRLTLVAIHGLCLNFRNSWLFWPLLCLHLLLILVPTHIVDHMSPCVVFDSTESSPFLGAKPAKISKASDSSCRRSY